MEGRGIVGVRREVAVTVVLGDLADEVEIARMSFRCRSGRQGKLAIDPYYFS